MPTYALILSHSFSPDSMNVGQIVSLRRYVGSLGRRLDSSQYCRHASRVFNIARSRPSLHLAEWRLGRLNGNQEIDAYWQNKERRCRLDDVYALPTLDHKHWWNKNALIVKQVSKMDHIYGCHRCPGPSRRAFHCTARPLSACGMLLLGIRERTGCREIRSLSSAVAF